MSDVCCATRLRGGGSTGLTRRCVRACVRADNQIQASGIAALAMALEHNTCLEHLSLYSTSAPTAIAPQALTQESADNDAGVEGAAAVARALWRNQTLRYLDLGRTCSRCPSWFLVRRSLSFHGKERDDERYTDI